MKDTANERLIRQIARELALEAMGRIRARLRAVEAAPAAERFYEAERESDGQEWPATALPGKEWVPYLLKDLELARSEFERCHH